jgi:glycosyl transferase family 1
MSKLFVGIFYAAYPVSIGNYFKRALVRRADVEIVHLGAAFGHSIPWGGGAGMILPYCDNPNIPLPQMNSVPIQMAEHLIQKQYGRLPDLFLQINAGFCLSNKSQCKNFMVLTDGHCLGDWYQQSKRDCDKVFNLHKNYSQPGEVALSYAYDLELCYPPDADIEKIYDAALIGMPYDHRTRVINKLKQAGLTVFYANGPAYTDATKIYHQAKVGINVPSLQDWNCRSFELRRLGLPVVETPTPDGEKVFIDGEHGLYARNDDEFVTKTKWLLEHHDEAQRIALAGYNKAKPYSYDNLVNEILSYC